MSKQLIVRLDEGELKVYTPEAGKEWSSIKRSEVLELIKEEIESLGVNTETGGGGSSIKQSEVERMVEKKIGLMKVKTGTGKEWNSIKHSEVERIVEEKIRLMGLNHGTEGVGHANGDMKNKNDLGGRIIEGDII